MKAICTVRGGALVFVALALCASADAEQYWGYTYNGIEVTAAGSAEHAATLAHKLAQLDAALVKTVAISIGPWRAPLRLYALPRDVFKKVWGSNQASVVLGGGSEDFILINNDNSDDPEHPYRSAYFSYTGALLSTQGLLRYPYWYRIGIFAVFAASASSDDRITIGGFIPWQVQNLLSHQLIPMRTLLKLHGDDPQLRNAGYAQLYEDQCWFFMHQILIEGKYHESANKYLDLMSAGQSEEEAFTASFNVAYEELDTFMRDALKHGTIKEMALMLPTGRAVAPQLLSPAEVNARLADFGVRSGYDVEGAMQRARDAISVEPNNERAWRALARGQVLEKKYAEALQSVERLSA